MEEYYNKNLISAIESVVLCSGTAKDTGNKYSYLNIKFKNSYEKRVFLNNEALFCVKDAIVTSQALAHSGIDSMDQLPTF